MSYVPHHQPLNRVFLIPYLMEVQSRLSLPGQVVSLSLWSIFFYTLPWSSSCQTVSSWPSLSSRTLCCRVSARRIS